MDRIFYHIHNLYPFINLKLTFFSYFHIVFKWKIQSVLFWHFHTVFIRGRHLSSLVATLALSFRKFLFVRFSQLLSLNDSSMLLISSTLRKYLQFFSVSLLFYQFFFAGSDFEIITLSNVIVEFEFVIDFHFKITLVFFFSFR